MRTDTRIFGAIAAAATLVQGHGYVSSFTTNGTPQQGYLLDYYYYKQNGQPVPAVAAWSAENLDLGFVAPSEYNTAQINCARNSAPGPLTVSIPAGGTMTFKWTAANGAWPHASGPILAYMADCGGAGRCATADKTQLRWVKVEATGINYQSQRWASQDLIANNNTWTAHVPKNLAPGDYVFRHEIIALHSASSPNGAQNYPQCFNIRVTGSGTAKLPTGTLGTDLYKADNPGILINVYTTITNYVMPGPALWSS
jgi:cellulase